MYKSCYMLYVLKVGKICQSMYLRVFVGMPALLRASCVGDRPNKERPSHRIASHRIAEGTCCTQAGCCCAYVNFEQICTYIQYIQYI